MKTDENLSAVKLNSAMHHQKNTSRSTSRSSDAASEEMQSGMRSAVWDVIPAG